MSEFLQSLIDNARRELDAMNVGAEHPQIRSALMDLRMAQSLLDRGMVSTDGKTDKGINFAFRAHIHNAIRALHAIADEPIKEIGQKVREGGHKGHAATYGDNPKQWAEMQATVDELAKDERLNWTAIKRQAAKEHGVCEKTIYRNCRNPRK